MDDEFMLAAWRKPPPHFARRLRENLHQLDSEPTVAHQRLPVLRVAGYAAALMIAVGAFALPAVQAAARAFLDMFRVVNLAPVAVQPERINALMTRQDLDLPGMLGEQVQVLKASSAPEPVATAEAAGAKAGMRVRLPAWRPVGLETQRIEVSGDQAFRVTADVQKLKRVLEAFGISDLAIPNDLDGKSAEVKVPAIVRISYADGQHRVMLLQGHQPQVSFPAGIDLSQLAEIGLRVLGIQPTEAHRFAQNVDWRTTLMVPVPANVSVFRQVDVQGNTGLLIESVRRNSRGTLPVESRVLWSSGNSVFALVGDMRPQELFEMAQSVQ